MTTVAVLSAGEMGSALAADLRAGGVRVVGTLDGRGSDTAERAREADMELLPDTEAVLRIADVVLSVVPPQHAVGLHRHLVDVAGRLRVRPLLADLNAVSPAAVTEMAAVPGGLTLVDGALLGAPPAPGRRPTRLLLSGPDAARVAGLPWSGVEVQVLGDRVGMASAAKACTGAVRKGVTALVVNALSTAAAHGVEEVVAAELQRSLRRDPVVEVELAAAKAWRFVPEMESVAATQAAAGLDPALYDAVADVFRSLSESPLADRRPADVDRGSGDPAARVRAVAQALRQDDPTPG